MTEDDLVAALRAVAADRRAPAPADREAIAETEAVCGYELPPLLVRLLTEVANGGFGPQPGIYGVRGHNWFSTDIFADMTEAAYASVDDPDWSRRRWLLPLMDWGCGIMTLIDCRDPAGALWGWDPHQCCLDHALFPLGRKLGDMPEESLTADYSERFYAGYFADKRRAEPVCVPLAWENGRMKPVTDS